MRKDVISVAAEWKKYISNECCFAISSVTWNMWKERHPLTHFESAFYSIQDNYRQYSWSLHDHFLCCVGRSFLTDPLHHVRLTEEDQVNSRGIPDISCNVLSSYKPATTFLLLKLWSPLSFDTSTISLTTQTCMSQSCFMLVKLILLWCCEPE